MGALGGLPPAIRAKAIVGWIDVDVEEPIRALRDSPLQRADRPLDVTQGRVHRGKIQRRDVAAP